MDYNTLHEGGLDNEGAWHLFSFCPTGLQQTHENRRSDFIQEFPSSQALALSACP